MQPRSPPTFGAPPSPPLIAQRQAAPQMYQADSAMRPDTPFHRLSLPSFSVGATVGSILLLISIIGVVLNSTGVAYYSQNVGSNQNEDWEDGDYDDLKDADSESTVDTMEILYKTPATLFVVGIILCLLYTSPSPRD